LGQYDLGIDQEIIEFKTEDEKDLSPEEKKFAERIPKIEEKHGYFDAGIGMPKPNTSVDAVDFTVRHCASIDVRTMLI
jgi:translation initiation factor eIF-2B subunit alpha